jgi:hypothetical protein
MSHRVLLPAGRALPIGYSNGKIEREATAVAPR